MANSQQEEISIDLHLDEEAFPPRYASLEAAGADLHAHVEEPIEIQPGAMALVPTGVAIALPIGYEAQVRPRSGLALRSQVTVLNAPGTIDSDYRGEICVILINHGPTPFLVQPAMRIAQLVVAPVCRAKFVAVTALSGTERGRGCFGHTGL